MRTLSNRQITASQQMGNPYGYVYKGWSLNQSSDRVLIEWMICSKLYEMSALLRLLQGMLIVLGGLGILISNWDAISPMRTRTRVR